MALTGIMMFLLFPGLFADKISNYMAITVFAGEDTSICSNENLILANLNASISGDVSDGLWFSTGDGYFLPGGASSVVFSTGTEYIPGAGDIMGGGFTLILVSDDPDGNGPMTEVSDMVDITFMDPPGLVCNSSINVSLDEQCEQLLDVTMLVANPIQPYERYIIEAFDSQGNIIPGNLLTSEHVGDNITFSVGHECTTNICWGTLTANDYLAPIITCSDVTIDCSMESSPEDVGFPIPTGASAVLISDNEYIVSDWDPCGDVNLTFTDVINDFNCTTPYSHSITRTWFAEDESNNQTSCVQTIFVERLGLASITLPPNYDNIDLPSLECGSGFPTLPNGHPDPNFTGFPMTPNCSNIQYTYEDIAFDICGNGVKYFRKWYILDWCAAEDMEYNQVIKVEDTTGPVIECPEDVTIYTDAYACLSESAILPELVSIEDCSDYTYTVEVHDAISNEAFPVYGGPNNYSVESLPLGTYEVTYTVTDDCNNSSTCSISLEVIDDKVPYAICDEFTKVALGDDGTARYYAYAADDGSFDNCEIDFMEVAKMTDECGHGTDFGEYVTFCCEEIGDTIMVAFQVTDIHGLANTCMIEVIVEDKLPPLIVCPPDITISCDYPFSYNNLSMFGSVVSDSTQREDIVIYDYYNNGVVGIDGYMSDNCSVSLETSETFDIECSQGSIIRKFIATDGSGNIDSCTQYITILNPDPFTLADIIWPADYEMEGCDSLQADPTVTGMPTFSNTECALVEATYHDQVFSVVEGSCVKILRTWTVIDWCQFIPPSTAIWEHLQVIKMYNTEGPEIFGCQDTIICTFSEDCDPEPITLEVSGSDDCTPEEDLLWSWTIDEDNDGIPDYYGTGNVIEIDLDYGEYTVNWKLEDRCGNTNTCQYNVEIKECKPPTPYCISSLTTVVMPSTGQISINASDYDFGSYDNCTPYQELIFSFSEDIDDQTRTFTCEDIENGISDLIELEMWVTDEHGNQDFCAIALVLQDNTGDICEDMLRDGHIEGRITTFKDIAVQNVEVDYSCVIEEYSGFAMSEEEGSYLIENIPNETTYTIRPVKEDVFDNGVNTLDLVLIQRHILGLKKFTLPYEVIAADVDGSERISGSDIVQLRKVILGVSDTFPNSVPSWKFVDSTYIFPDTLNPWENPDSLIFHPLMEEERKASFTAIKMGDVNGSVKDFSDENQSSSRNQAHLFNIEVNELSGGLFIANFKSEPISDVFGYQLGLQFDPEKIEFVEFYGSDIDVTEDLFSFQNASHGLIRTLWHTAERNEIDDNTILFSLLFRKKNETTNPQFTVDDRFSSEIYNGSGTKDIILHKEDTTSPDIIDNGLKVSASQNPFETNVTINIDASEGQKAQLSLYDYTGKLLYQNNKELTIGKSQIELSEVLFPGPGLYFFSVNGKARESVLKLVKH